MTREGGDRTAHGIGFVRAVMKKKIYSIIMIAAVVLALSTHVVLAAEADGEAMVGKVAVKFVTPEGLSRVDGRNAKADAYIKSLEPKFKLNVLAVYADPAEWNKFVSTVSARQPAAIPRYAMICVPSKMPKKSFSNQAVRKEFKRYANWFSAAANNRPLAALLTSQGNKKLKEYMGVDIGFKFRTGDNTKKISETSNAISFGAEVDFNIFGRPSKVYLTASALQVADKMIFLAYFENREGRDIVEIQGRAVAWRSRMSAANPGR